MMPSPGRSLPPLDENAPRADRHWHHTMVQPRFWGLFDLRASLALLFCFVNIFEWWHTKLTILVLTVLAFAALEARRMTPEVALRQAIAWVRGPVVPAIATRSQTALGRRRTDGGFGSRDRRRS